MIFSNTIMFASMLIISTIIIISSPSWICMWMGLEINMMAFIPILHQSKNKLATESSIKYFLTQAFASVIMLFAIIMTTQQDFNLIMSNSSIILMASGIKLGAAPFHMWFPPVAEGLPWLQNFILMTWQKIAPLYIMSLMMQHPLMFIMVLASAIIGSVNALNQSSMRKIMAYSSITHMSWMIAPMIINSSMWMIYMLIYFITTMIMLISFSTFNIYHTSQMMMLSTSMLIISLFTINFLSMGGFPPLFGFMGKWLILNLLIEANMTLIPMVMVMSSWMNMYIYLRIIHPLIMIKSSQLKINFVNQSHLMILSMLTLLSTMGMTSIILM
uniref:NADH-ubiquinone oxidoreductase chain 2 n=1 Tax=Eremobates cf. palpisetulosus SEM-2008 TaxID=507470 RepID=B2CKE6_9ARAC|nr:NADH dehydrogenase subunit 2 [Eremobates cf. palpisetulosus SEM-2008]ACA49834.1 NADH dehydrogenase subunit 2 [Eremobates cf. palpisetulosus SEM-2008]